MILKVSAFMPPMPNEIEAADLYHEIKTTEPVPNYDVFATAYLGLSKMIEANKLAKPNLLTVIDYTKSSNEKRLWTIDLAKRKTKFFELVSHGKNSGEYYAKKFSNTSGSHMSSLGFYKTGNVYYGKHDRSLKLHGLEPAINCKAFERGIVIHGAHYVSTAFIRQHKRLGRSWGCPALRPEIKDKVIDEIANGSCLFIYYPEQNYLKNSNYLN